MGISSFVINVVCCAVLQVFASLLLPEGRMRAFTLSIIGLYLFYCLLSPVVELVFGNGLVQFFVAIKNAKFAR